VSKKLTFSYLEVSGSVVFYLGMIFSILLRGVSTVILSKCVLFSCFLSFVSF